ncbi:MAG: hypothetical protein ABIB93_00770 [Chloroflexota bacterium]
MLSNIERYKQARELQRDLVAQLFQRLNFFLLATTFIISALAAILASPVFFGHDTDGRLILLSHFICGAGYYIAFFFTFINYLNARLLKKLSKYLDEKEKTGTRLPVLKEILAKVVEKTCILKQISYFFCDSRDVVFYPFRNRIHWPPYTWFLPLFFWVFWFLIWLFVLPEPTYGIRCTLVGYLPDFIRTHYTPFFFGIVLPILIVGLLKFIHWFLDP